MSSNSRGGVSQAPAAASAEMQDRPFRRFSDADQTATAFGRLFVSSDHVEGEQTHAALNLTEPTPLSPPHMCASAECSVTKVFETTELLELVLSFLRTSDVLGLRLICRTWDSVTRTSPLLRLHSFVHSQWNRPPQEYQLLDFSLPGLTISSGDAVEMGRWIEVTMTRAAAQRISPKPGRRSRALSVHEGLQGLMRAQGNAGNDSQLGQQSPDVVASQLQHDNLYVVQPPIVGLQAFTVPWQPSAAGPSNGARPRAKPRVIAKLHCDTGITLGFLAEAVQKLLPDAGEGDIEAKRVLLFRAIVSFASPDPKPKDRDGRRSIVYL